MVDELDVQASGPGGAQQIGRGVGRTTTYLAWGILGVFSLLFFADRWYWLVLTLVPWLLAAVLLHIRDRRLSQSDSRPTQFRAGPFGVVLATLGLAVATLFGVNALVLLLVWGGCLGLIILRLRGPKGLQDVVSGCAILGVTLLLCSLVAEWVVSRPVFARQWGSPEEQAGWADRYDPLARGNQFGFRSPYESVRKPRDTYRMLVLGDSMTWGDKVAATDSTWPAQLEMMLRSSFPDRSIEVVNMARPGFTTMNEVEVLNGIGWQFDPDLVMIQVFRNDAFPSRPGLRSESSSQVFGRFRLLPSRFRDTTAGRSALLFFIETKIDSFIPKDFERLYEDSSPGWLQVQAALQDLAKSAHEREVPVLGLLIPAFHPGSWSRSTHPDRIIHDKLASAMRSAGIEVLDLTDAFGQGADDGRDWWATPYDGHPSAEGHGLIAQATLAWMTGAGLVRTDPKDEPEQ